jgi:hypothetical protein
VREETTTGEYTKTQDRRHKLATDIYKHRQQATALADMRKDWAADKDGIRTLGATEKSGAVVAYPSFDAYYHAIEGSRKPVTTAAERRYAKLQEHFTRRREEIIGMPRAPNPVTEENYAIPQNIPTQPQTTVNPRGTNPIYHAAIHRRVVWPPAPTDDGGGDTIVLEPTRTAFTTGRRQRTDDQLPSRRQRRRLAPERAVTTTEPLGHEAVQIVANQLHQEETGRNEAETAWKNYQKKYTQTFTPSSEAIGAKGEKDLWNFNDRVTQWHDIMQEDQPWYGKVGTTLGMAGVELAGTTVKAGLDVGVPIFLDWAYNEIYKKIAKKKTSEKQYPYESSIPYYWQQQYNAQMGLPQNQMSAFWEAQQE